MDWWTAALNSGRRCLNSDSLLRQLALPSKNADAGERSLSLPSKTYLEDLTSALISTYLPAARGHCNHLHLHRKI